MEPYTNHPILYWIGVVTKTGEFKFKLKFLDKIEYVQEREAFECFKEATFACCPIICLN